tara:strand:+ start:31753 stop:33267 length:1515 start_codon:yes stop_codon:yes gene_type:complete
MYKIFCVAVLAIFATSCQEDFNAVGSDIIGDPNFEFDLYDEASVVAYSRRANPVQTNNLPVYHLGIYNDPVYGITQANVLAQVTMNQTNPSFGENPEIEKVYLNIPYFSTTEGTGVNQSYKLDSIFGNIESEIKLSIYESNYFLRDLDPNTGFEETQKYYSNQGPLFQSFLGELLTEVNSFAPSPEEVDTLSPRLRVELPNAFFEEKILNQEGNDVLLNNTNFKDHFRGIHFIAEYINGDGVSFLFDITQGNIEIQYTRDDDDPEAAAGARTESTFNLSFNGITVNTFNNNFPPAIEESLNNPDLSGEENLYLKGGSGTFSVIELFGPDLDGNGVADELDDLRDKKWLVNEANIVLNVNKDLVTGGNYEPERIFLYDLNNNRILVDYQLDNLTPPTDPINYKSTHSERLKKDASGNGESYKIRITNHISNLINNDSTNVKLGLVVTQNINVITSQTLQNTVSPGVEEVPTGSVISPEGTILYGSHPENPEKRIRLNIYYTEIDN